MKRRKFIYAGALAAAPLSFNVARPKSDQTTERSLIEWRTYRIRFSADLNQLKSYLLEVYLPALKAEGVDNFQLFRDYSLQEPINLYLAINYPDAACYVRCQQLMDQPAFQAAGKTYHDIPPEEKIYNRFESWLLNSFSGLPNMATVKEENQLFELRTYEGYSEDAVRRKILMFNKEEIDLFYKVGLDPVYFGDMIAGPYRPSLSYMVQFKNMEERDRNWSKFFEHPEWKRMLALREYANTVNHIHKQFLIRA